MKKFQLQEKGNRDVFRVPEGYFGSLESQLNQRIAALEAGQQMEIRAEAAPRRGLVLTMQSIRPVLYMAAMFVLLLFSIGLVFKYSSGRTDSLRAQQTTTEQVIPTAEDYLINSVGTYGISQYYVESQVTE